MLINYASLDDPEKYIEELYLIFFEKMQNCYTIFKSCKDEEEIVQQWVSTLF